MQTLEVQPIEPTLEVLESEIEQGFNALRRALFQVRERRLWMGLTNAFDKPVYESFEHYCQVRWGLGRTQANKHALAGQVDQEMLDAGVSELQLPHRLEHAIALKDVDPNARLDVLQTAQQITGGQPTTEAIAAARKIVNPEPGQRYKVIAEGNAHYDEIITANEVKNGVVIGLETPYPFMAAELRPVDPPAEPDKPARLTATQRASMYAKLLTEVLSHPLPQDLHSRIEAALAA